MANHHYHHYHHYSSRPLCGVAIAFVHVWYCLKITTLHLANFEYQFRTNFCNFERSRDAHPSYTTPDLSTATKEAPQHTQRLVQRRPRSRLAKASMAIAFPPTSHVYTIAHYCNCCICRASTTVLYYGRERTPSPRLQGYKVTRLQGCKVARLQRYKVTKLQHFNCNLSTFPINRLDDQSMSMLDDVPCGPCFAFALATFLSSSNCVLVISSEIVKISNIPHRQYILA